MTDEEVDAPRVPLSFGAVFKGWYAKPALNFVLFIAEIAAVPVALWGIATYLLPDTLTRGAAIAFASIGAAAAFIVPMLHSWRFGQKIQRDGWVAADLRTKRLRARIVELESAAAGDPVADAITWMMQQRVHWKPDSRLTTLAWAFHEMQVLMTGSMSRNELQKYITLEFDDTAPNARRLEKDAEQRLWELPLQLQAHGLLVRSGLPEFDAVPWWKIAPNGTAALIRIGRDPSRFDLPRSG